MSNIKVSVICLVYNHEDYLRACLDGFVNQKCDFDYEVIVHDDASTDNSELIIKEYEQKYPDIIKPIFQEENQHSKGIRIIASFILSKINGDYIAICEGDDCWIDNRKLQIQYDYMKNNPDCSICTHNAIVHNVNNNVDYLRNEVYTEKDYSLEEIIKSGGDLFSTNTIFIRKEAYTNRPECFVCPGVSDYQTVFYARLLGRCHYIPRVMSKYNFNAKGSWTERIWNNKDLRIKHLKDMVNMLNNVNQYYMHQYENIINDKIRDLEFEILVLTDDFDGMREKKYKILFDNYVNEHKYLKKQLLYFDLKRKMPLVIKAYEIMKNRK